MPGAMSTARTEAPLWAAGTLSAPAPAAMSSTRVPSPICPARRKPSMAMGAVMRLPVSS